MRVQPKLHASGHFHHPERNAYTIEDAIILHVNAAYKQDSPPIWVEIENGNYVWGPDMQKCAYGLECKNRQHGCPLWHPPAPIIG